MSEAYIPPSVVVDPVAAIAAPVPVVAAPAAVVPPVARPQQKHHNNNNKRANGMIQIPQAAFKEHLNREASQMLKTKLGVTLEEAVQLLASRSTGTQVTAAGVANEVVEKLQREKLAAESREQKLKKENIDLLNKHKKDIQRHRDKNTELELRVSATSFGIRETDFAMHLFARAVASGKATDPKAFFSGLRASHPYLFTPGAAVVEPVVTEVPAGTAPPESNQPGEQKPTPAVAGEASKGPKVDEMDGRQFGQHLRAKYGFTPGM